MKKAFKIVIIVLVFLLNTASFFSFSQDNLIENDNTSLVYASISSGDSFFDNSNETDDVGVAANNPTSKTSYAILGSSLILMLLIKTKNGH